jgi:hypothetical protein
MPFPPGRATQRIRRCDQTRKWDDLGRRIRRRGGGGDMASIIGILLRADSREYDGIIVNAGKHRDEKNACQYNV